jgi:hypothetical protein
MTTPLQLFIHLVKHHVGQQRRQGAALRRPLIPFLHHAIAHDAAVQVRANQPDDSGIVNAFP